MTLTHLANHTTDASVWDSLAQKEPVLWSDARRVLLSCAAAAAGAAVHEEAVRALANLAMHANNRCLMWADEQIVSAVLHAGTRRRGGDRQRGVRKQGFRALCYLSAEAANRHSMWMETDTLLQLVVIDAATTGETSEQALCVLANLAFEPANRQSMWRNKEARALLLAAVAAGLPGSSHAIRALANLTEDPSVRLSMGLPPARVVGVSTSDPPPAKVMVTMASTPKRARSTSVPSETAKHHRSR